MLCGAKSVLCVLSRPLPIEGTGKERCTRENPDFRDAKNKAGAPCRWRARLPGLPEKGMEGKVYEEDSNSAAFCLSCFALSSMALCYRNILTEMRRLRSDFVKNCEAFVNEENEE